MYLITGLDKECVGCEACSNICPKQCIRMEQDKEGFFYPTINNDLCINCHLCEKVCPIQISEIKVQSENSADIFAVKHKDKRIQMESSSGGAFTAIAENVINQGGIVYASCFNMDNEVEICRIEKTSELTKARKSKYVQSKMNGVHNIIMEDLNSDKNVLFVGTACQCDSVRTFLNIKKVDCTKLLLVDIICHGVSSPQIWLEYLHQIEEKNNDKIVNIDFRDKTNGWAPMKMNISFKNSKNYEKYSRFDGYYRLFFGHYIIRPACHACRYTNMSRKTDITIADFWGIKDIAPELYDEYGVSMAIVNSEKGRFLIDQIKNVAEINKVRCDNISQYQPNLKRPTPPNKKRIDFWTMYSEKGFTKAFKKYGEFSIYDRVIDDIKNIVVRMIK